MLIDELGGKSLNELEERRSKKKKIKVQFFIQLNTCYSAHTPYLPEVLQKGRGRPARRWGQRAGDRRGDVEEERGHLWVEMGIRRRDGCGGGRGEGVEWGRQRKKVRVGGDRGVGGRAGVYSRGRGGERKCRDYSSCEWDRTGQKEHEK